METSANLQILKSLISSSSHYIDIAEAMLEYKLSSNLSERSISAFTGVSKSEVHRLLKIARISPELKEAAKKHQINKYVLVIFSDKNYSNKEQLARAITEGKLRSWSQAKRMA